MAGTREDPYDVIISGAGPGGITAGILCGRLGMKAVILEKEETAGIFPRGETLHAAKIFSQVLGENVLNLVAKHITAGRKFYSPNVIHQHEVFRNSPSIVYHWDDFIGLLHSRLNETPVKIQPNVEVIEPILEGKICIGVKTATNEEIYGRTIIAAEGHASKLGRFMDIPYEKINNPIIKRLVKNLNSDYNGFTYFFIAQGQLPSYPYFPPCIIFIFPRGNREAEVGLMIFKHEALKLKKYCEIPDEKTIFEVWNKLIHDYPCFSVMMKDTQKTFEGLTEIAAGHVHKEPIQIPGLVPIGGTIGFVEQSGASGIASAMLQAKFIIDFLHTHGDEMKTGWSPKLKKNYSRAIKRSKMWDHIISNERKTKLGLNLVLIKLRTAEKINKYWDLFKKLF